MSSAQTKVEPAIFLLPAINWRAQFFWLVTRRDEQHFFSAASYPDACTGSQ